MDKTSIQASVTDYIQSEFLQEDKSTLEPDTPLITGGVLDSISTIKLVSYLEDHYSVEFAAHEVAAEYLDSVATIAETVANKLANK